MLWVFLAMGVAPQVAMAADGGISSGQSFALLGLGIVLVLGLIIGLKLNAFLALILSALAVSLGVGALTGANPGSRLSAVIDSFGSSAGGIGIAIAMAAIIGKCMLDSGAADRIVRFAVAKTGQAKASLGLMLSGFVLAVPVFFDTVFYLLVPLARSLHRSTGKHYLKYLMAIATGGAITHTLVPPTPGPLLVAATLGVDVGMMMMIGALVAIPAALVGLAFSIFVDKKSPVEMRPLGSGAEKHNPLPDDQLPSLWVSLLPVILPVVLIGIGTLATTIADNEDRARLTVEDIRDFEQFAELASASEPQTPMGRFIASQSFDDEDRALLAVAPPAEERSAYIETLNRALAREPALYDRETFLGVKISDVALGKIDADQQRMKPVDRTRLNRSLLETAYPDLIEPHQWDSPARRWANRMSLYSNANFALTLAAIVAMLTLKRTRRLSWKSLAEDTEEALMSGGIIILITAAGGAFGAMLKDTEISDAIREYFLGSQASGIALLLLAWSIAAVLKIAQGSSTVAMIVGAGMMSAIIGDARPEFHLVYVAAAVGTGSLMGSWMNDSGFWVFTKMGGLTEAESLRSWTPLLATLSLAGLISTIALSQAMPLAGDSGDSSRSPAAEASIDLNDPSRTVSDDRCMIPGDRSIVQDHRTLDTRPVLPPRYAGA